MILYLGFLLSSIEAAVQVSSPCEYQSSTTANCSNLSLRMLPIQLHDDTIILDASDNRIVIIPDDAFAGRSQRKLTHIDLSRNIISIVTKGSFRGVENLEVLNLKHNKIKYLHPDTFKNHQKLSFLYLSINRMSFLDDDSFLNLPTQNISLYLDFCMINNFTSDTFGSAPNMKLLNLAHNNLISINNHAFKNLNHLTSLDLSNNQIQKFGSLVFEMNHGLKNPELDQNSEVLENVTLQTTSLLVLDISNNQLEYLPEIIFKGLTSLQKLYISRNKLRELNTDTFATLEHLRILHIDYNRLRKIDDKLFLNLNNLVELLLNNNELESLHNVFSNLRHLKVLDISNNKIKILHQDDFGFSKELVKLNLGENLLTLIPSYAFVPLTNLEELFLCHNKIQSFGPTVFDTTTKLRILNVCCNHIKYLSEDQFRTLTNLEQLDLSENRINLLSKHMLVNLQNLKSLVVGKNEMKQINLDIFSELHNLLTLFVNENKIQRIYYSSLDHLKNLARIDLSGNLLSCNCSLHGIWKFCQETGICSKISCISGKSKELKIWDEVMNKMICDPEEITLLTEDVSLSVQGASHGTNNMSIHLLHPVHENQTSSENSSLRVDNASDDLEISVAELSAIICISVLIIVGVLSVLIVRYIRNKKTQMKEPTKAPEYIDVLPNINEVHSDEILVNNTYYSPSHYDSLNSNPESRAHVTSGGNIAEQRKIRSNDTPPQLPSRIFDRNARNIHTIVGFNDNKQTTTCDSMQQPEIKENPYTPESRIREKWLHNLNVNQRQPQNTSEVIYHHYEEIE
ncbi:insulin-like growth factor-binding protein complex acid labile subunit isoform X2 [Periplaneta americana]